jgi:hypothetical protein
MRKLTRRKGVLLMAKRQAAEIFASVNTLPMISVLSGIVVYLYFFAPPETRAAVSSTRYHGQTS